MNFTKEHLNVDRICSMSTREDRKKETGWQKDVPVKWYFENNTEMDVIYRLNR